MLKKLKIKKKIISVPVCVEHYLVSNLCLTQIVVTTLE